MTELVHREKAHVLPLDSIRGVAATSVVIHHLLLMPTFLTAFPHNAWINCSFFRSAWLLVDLFFVLSGMVMSLGYVDGDFGRFSLREFMVRRLARVYPLHIVMLIANLLFRLLRIGLVTAGVVVAAPAAFEVNNAYSFVLNVFLLHSMGFIDYLSWNAPSWSISVEFYTYLVFGLIVLLAQRMRSLLWFYVLCGLLVVGSFLFIVFVVDKRSLGLQTDFGILRCFVSFFLGVLTVKVVPLLAAQAGSGPAGPAAIGCHDCQYRAGVACGDQSGDYLPCATDFRDLPRQFVGFSRCAAGAADLGGKAVGLARTPVLLNLYGACARGAVRGVLRTGARAAADRCTRFDLGGTAGHAESRGLTGSGAGGFSLQLSLHRSPRRQAASERSWKPARFLGISCAIGAADELRPA
ncbi:acyltransferase family protein [Bradyrhizobium sp. LB13.1]